MTMRKILLIAWCIEFSTQDSRSPETTAGFEINMQKLPNFSLKWPFLNVGSNRIAEASIPTPQSQVHKQNFSQKEYGYSHSEFYDSNVASEMPKNTIPDSRLLYHSFNNPLFQSQSLNFEQSGKIIHSISDPFQSKWLVLPASKTIEKRKIPNLDTLLSKEIHPFNDSKPGDLKLNLLTNLTLENKKNLSNWQTLIPGTFTTTTTQQPNSKKTFFGYNFKEVKTGEGKIRGLVQVFDANGLKENIEYNEKGLVNKSANGINATRNTTVDKDLKNGFSVISSTQSTIPTTASLTFEDVFEPNTFGYPPFAPFNRDLITYNQREINQFPSPELILFDFLGRLPSVPSINERGNFLSDELSTIDESVSGNTFFYSD